VSSLIRLSLGLRASEPPSLYLSPVPTLDSALCPRSSTRLSTPLSLPRPSGQPHAYSPNPTLSFSPTAAAYSLRSPIDNSASSESSNFEIRLWLQLSLVAS